MYVSTLINTTGVPLTHFCLWHLHMSILFPETLLSLYCLIYVELCDDLCQCSSTALGSDFTIPDPAEMNVMFTTGSMNGDTDCLTISIIDDDALEGGQSFSISLNPPAPPVTLTTPSSSPLTITDNDGRGNGFGLEFKPA